MAVPSATRVCGRIAWETCIVNLEGCLVASQALPRSAMQVIYRSGVRKWLPVCAQPALASPSLLRRAVWTGVRLRDVLRAAGLEDEDPEVQHIQARQLLGALPPACVPACLPACCSVPRSLSGLNSPLDGCLPGAFAGCCPLPQLTPAAPSCRPACSLRGSTKTWRGSSTAPALRVRSCRTCTARPQDTTPALPALLHVSPFLLLPCLPTLLLCCPVPTCILHCLPVPIPLQWTKPWTQRATCCLHLR